MNAKGNHMLQTEDILGIIPARMASSRFPGKPVVPIRGIPMVIRVYREVQKVLSHVAIASGDGEIEAVAREYGARFIHTAGDHSTGTSRCAEALENYTAQTGTPISALLNIQGDEPLVTPEAVALLATDISRSGSRISTLVRHETDLASLANPNRVKVAMDRNGRALYFSRSPLPYFRNPGSGWFSHVGMYAFRSETLKEIIRLEPGTLEMAESLEQLRWLENGYPVHCVPTDYKGFGIDTPEDLEEMLRSGLI